MTDNDNSQGGGISVFVQEHISFKVRDDLNVILPFIETLFIEFIVNDKKYICNAFHPPVPMEINEPERHIKQGSYIALQ